MRGRHWLQLASGAPFPLEGPFGRLAIGDVATALSKICRFAGACEPFYSVAQHAVVVAGLVGEMGGSIAGERWALLHDAHEMILGDIPAPTKRVLAEYGVDLTRFEHDMDARIGRALIGTAWRPMGRDMALIKRADLVALATERRDLMAPAAARWAPLPEPRETPIRPLAPREAEALFLREWASIERRMVEVIDA